MADADGPLVLRTDAAHVATLTMDRPRSRNALSRAMLAALAEQLAAVEADPSVHVVVLAGNGPAFSAGHDLREIQAHPDAELRERLFAQCSDLMVQVARLRQPVIAAVAGVATAAGCQLVASCDLAVAGASARFATPGVDIGLFCSTPMVALTRAVAPKHAMELLLTGDLVGAEEAARIGLVNRVVPDAELASAVAALAGRIAAKSPLTVAIGKEASWRQRDLPVVDAYAYTSAVMARNLDTADATEGIAAFLEKRDPTWQGR
ncbi:enoyl-CoA hydratase [Aquihabitans sp. G128]|uniref:enoyl-CoA hydratase n=1 Tax=Aquihabitans sp. G128 TaxID=2849779 RepID=UPI001C23F34C|nr:enoyl-CoA hydratase [Aquihabitans sp. G128]QXC63027.1 enoyl-CoA hydratase [Aquihabitans sp. G128]